MRLTPPLTFIALSVTGVALYKSAPPETKSKAKATFNSIRTKLSDWLRPEDVEEEIEEYEFNEDGEIEQQVQGNQDKDDPDDKMHHLKRPHERANQKYLDRESGAQSQLGHYEKQRDRELEQFISDFHEKKRGIGALANRQDNQRQQRIN